MKSTLQAGTEEVEGEKVTSQTQSWLDGLAIGFAGVCGIHCLLMPVLLIVFPLVGSSFFVDERFHMWMLYVVIPTTTLAVFLGCRRHKDRRVITLSAIGLSLLIVGALIVHPHEEHVCEEDHDHTAHSHSHHHHDHAHNGWGTWLSVAGGIFLVSAHWRNHRLCRKDRCCHCH